MKRFVALVIVACLIFAIPALAADSATPTVNTEVEYETLQKGSKGDAVKQVQKYLIALGYLSGKADGDYGDKTVNAVSGFQKANNLEVTGIADNSTQQKLAELGAAAAAKVEGREAVGRLITTYDKVENLTWYEHKNMPKYADVCCYIYPYIGHYDTGITWLRVKMNYTDAKTDAGWIFFNQVIFSVDGVNTVKHFSQSDIVRDNDTEVWEVADFVPKDDEVELLRRIAASDETIIRFEGDDHYVDHTVTNKEKEAIVDVLLSYDYLLSES